jgi:hypothetical protein
VLHSTSLSPVCCHTGGVLPKEAASGRERHTHPSGVGECVEGVLLLGWVPFISSSLVHIMPGPPIF